ncbi:NADH-quinone oxidoreductase subunit NuoN [Candidatus Pantoea edessiphila]|uniref:NADH-quinone oxidoreductase subunit N n=1 Tax=Candidatus Pantoea edessiphila TaxID=2044610 RepID=A0A2P5SYJ6_9GAMM|nr:NADH-quinone oxidoreductase subunit NuoN [Candidatus Pantoea edessiphila]MBK4775467.1 NADH-quinone oxidoreductase subunit NuoN [Pantoea sp. Edef]PPI87406.1 NADH-quinone oxidoreductase subunit NuoN [Candidatus Pantoea edessiphila]
MITVPNQLIASLPLIVIGCTILILLVFISWRRNHLCTALLTCICLVLSCSSLYFVNNVSSIDIMSLLYVDSYSIFYTILIIISTLTTSLFGYVWLSNFLDHQEEFYILLLISTLGSIILVSTNNFVTLFLGIELLSLPLFGLIGYTFHKKTSLEASIKYTILSAMASSFLLFGIAFIYFNCGDLNFLLIGAKFISNDLIKEPLFLIGFGMVITSIGFKLSLVPFHIWTPDVYQGAPASVSAFLSTVSKISIFSAITRLFIYIPITNSMAITNSLVMIAFMSILLGNIMAMFQQNIKRLLGYSSISHFGYLLVSLIALKYKCLSLESSGIYIISYLISILGVFGIIVLISRNVCPTKDADSLCYYRGLFWQNPILSTIMTIMMLSMAGIPLTLGFIGKFYILSLSMITHLWWLTVAIIISSIIGVYYYLRITLSFYQYPSKINNYIISNNWIFTPLGIILLIIAILNFLLGIYPQPLINLMQFVHAIAHC